MLSCLLTIRSRLLNKRLITVHARNEIQKSQRARSTKRPHFSAFRTPLFSTVFLLELKVLLTSRTYHADNSPVTGDNRLRITGGETRNRLSCYPLKSLSCQVMTLILYLLMTLNLYLRNSLMVSDSQTSRDYVSANAAVKEAFRDI